MRTFQIIAQTGKKGLLKYGLHDETSPLCYSLFVNINNLLIIPIIHQSASLESYILGMGYQCSLAQIQP